MRSLTIALAVLLVASTAHAVPGPDSVAVVANADVPGSVALAMRYASLRSVPARQVCALSLPTTDDITLDEFQTRLLGPLRACLGTSIEARIEAVVLMRGVPLRVTIPIDGGHHVSVAAALATWRSTLTDGTTPLLGTAPGASVPCGGGSTCYGARVSSAWNGFDAFTAGYTATSGGVVHRPVLVTMLHGRTDADAGHLLDAAMAAEAAPPSGEFVLMRGADAARGALDGTYASVASDLGAQGRTASVVDFDTMMTGRALAGFVTGTASLGATIEGNTYVSGALVDNLTSFGAVPENFAPTGENQVSIARWVTAGVAGAHGTVDEPLNNCFPSRYFLVRYADGATLAEAYHSSLPFVYWLNLVLGDPMLAPYAQRPTVAIDGVADHASLAAATPITIAPTPPRGRTIAHVSLFVNGDEVASTDGPVLAHCLAATNGAMEVLAVATTAPRADGSASPWPAKGWTMLHLTSTSASSTCSVDAGAIDAAVIADAGPDAGALDGRLGHAACSCRAARGTHPPLAWVTLGLLVLLVRRTRRSHHCVAHIDGQSRATSR
jgi:MYXO-CTERM domain-containing protein